jgi:hypothetical protein
MHLLNNALTVRTVSTRDQLGRDSVCMSKRAVVLGGPKASERTNERSSYAFRRAGTASPRC